MRIVEVAVGRTDDIDEAGIEIGDRPVGQGTEVELPRDLPDASRLGRGPHEDASEPSGGRPFGGHAPGRPPDPAAGAADETAGRPS